MKLKYVIDSEKPILVKDYLKMAGLSRQKLKSVRMLDNIRINGENGKNWYELKNGDVLELEFTEELNDEIMVSETSEMLDIVYEDEYFLVVNKPSYLSSQPSKKHQSDNLLSIVKKHFILNNENTNMHLVNRLDFQTSGLIIIAKSGIIHYELSKIDIEKEYLCVVEGLIDGSGEINKPISRYPAPEIRRYIDFESGKKAITLYKALKYDNKRDQTLLSVKLLTGRTHQIRLHFSSINHALIGDKLYNKNYENKDKDTSINLYLHAYHLSFIHPFTKEKIDLINYPDWFNNF